MPHVLRQAGTRLQPWPARSRSGTAVLLCNLGTPDAPTAPALRRYLAEFLGDRRVVEIPRLLWWLILHGIILRVRPARSAAKYASVWLPEGSPLKVWTEKQASHAARLSRRTRAPARRVRHAMRYGNPSIASVLDELQAEGVAAHPGAAAVSAVFGDDHRQRDRCGRSAGATRIRHLPEFRFVNRYHDDPGYIAALARRVTHHWAQHGRPDKLVMSFHGLPQRNLLLGDPYHCECLKTARLVGERLGVGRDDLVVTFQSRFGSAEVAATLYRADAGRAGRAGRQAGRRAVPRLRRRLPGNARGNRDRGARRLPRRRRRDLPLPAVPERPARVDRRAERHGADATCRAGRRTALPSAQELEARRERALARGAAD